jgi:hypothetical protein
MSGMARDADRKRANRYNNKLFLKENMEHAEMRWNVLIKRKT